MIRVFPRRTKFTPTDAMAFVGDPPLFRPTEDLPVSVSVTFTWDIPEAERLYRSWSDYYSDVKIGGPAVGDPGSDFEPGRFVKDGVVITSRGCPKNCEWCFVPVREGNIREIKISDGYNIIDNNLLACSMRHIEAVFEMLSDQSHAAVFSGGLDAEFFNEKHVELLDSIRVSKMFFAHDHMGSTYNLEKVSEMLSHYSRDKKRCYVLINYYKEDRVKKAKARLLKVWELGFMPFAMFFCDGAMKKVQAEKEWQDLTRIFTRPAITRGYCKKFWANDVLERDKSLTNTPKTKFRRHEGRHNHGREGQKS